MAVETSDSELHLSHWNEWAIAQRERFWYLLHLLNGPLVVILYSVFLLLALGPRPCNQSVPMTENELSLHFLFWIGQSLRIVPQTECRLSFVLHRHHRAAPDFRVWTH